jgi:hypothetical protein
MAKDKLITIRIEGEKLEAFKKWTEQRNLNLSTFLYDVVDACLDGQLDERIVMTSRIDDSRIVEIEQSIAALQTVVEGVATTVREHDDAIRKETLARRSLAESDRGADKERIAELLGK